MLLRRSTLPPHPPAKLTPAPSYSCKLFCAPKKVNPYQISNFQTLFAKYPRWGHLRIHSISLAPPITCATQRAIPSALNQLRILPVAMGVYPHTPSLVVLVSGVQAQASSFQELAASLRSLCPVFRAPAVCFQSFAASFRKTPGWGALRPLPPLLPLLPLLPLQQC